MVEKPQPVSEGVTQRKVEEVIQCLCPGDHWKELKPRPAAAPFPTVGFLQAIRHEVQFQHIRDGITTGGIKEPAVENLDNLSTEEQLDRIKLLKLFTRSPFKTPQEAFYAAFPEVLEQAREREQLDMITKAPPQERRPRLLDGTQIVFDAKVYESTTPREKSLQPKEPPELQEEIGAEKIRELDLAAIARIKAGDAEAFGEIYGRYVDRVHRQIYYRTGSNEVAEDLTSQVFLNAFRAIGRYEDTHRPLVVWLLSIAHNLLTDYYRAKRDTTNIEDVVIRDVNPENDPVTASGKALENEGLRKAIGKLKKRDQQSVVVMRYIDEMDYPEIAVVLNKSEGAVRVILHRALLALRGIMGAEEVPVSQEKERKITEVPPSEKFSYKALAEILGMKHKTLVQKIWTAERRGQLELSPSPGQGGGKKRLTREDVAAVLKYLGEDPSFSLTIPYR